MHQSVYSIIKNFQIYYYFYTMTDFLHKLSTYTFKTHSQPYSRIGHRAILKDSNILVFGGTNFHNQVVTQTLNINCESYEITLLNTKNTVPIENFTLNSYESMIFLWGGKRTSGGNIFVSNELWKFQNNLFTKVSQKGTTPEPRMMHSSIIYSKKYMVIYGGICETKAYNDWHSLDLETYEWKKMTTNLQLPLNLEAKIVWLDTRGVILITQKWNLQKSKIEHCCDLYEFKIRKRPDHLHVQLQKIQVDFKQPFSFRAFPTFCKYKTDTLCVAIIGGEKFGQDESENSTQIFSDCWIINLETYESAKANDVHLNSKYGHEAVFYKDRILLIGGICSPNEFSTFLETIDFKLKYISIDRKLCQACKSIYGLEDYTKHKFSIKCQYQANPRSYVSAKLVKKFAQVIQNPIKAFGLLIDNSLNMNANMIDIDFRKVQMDSRIYRDPEQTVLEITDNSYGFSKDQILQSLFTFGYKVQSCTHDSKFEEQLAVRKQFGLNLKLAGMRLGKSCLIMINTIEQEKFVGFFSIDPNKCPEFKNRFNCFYYFINEKNVSSEINKHIIKRNVEHLINLEELQQSISVSTSKILLFDLNFKSELKYAEDQKNVILQQPDEEGILFDNLKTYLKYLYLKPYVGRKIKVMGENIQCESLAERFKKDEIEGKIKKVDLMKYINCPNSYEIIGLYQILDKEYANKKIVFYSENRLIQSFDFSFEMICGIVDLKPCIEIRIGKGSVQTQIEQRQLRKSLTSLIDQIQPKRSRSIIRTMKSDEKKNLGTSVKKRKT